MKHLLTVLVVIILIANVVSNCNAQAPDTLWTNVYGGINEDYGQAIKQTADGGFIIGGHGNSFGNPEGDIFLIKTDEFGDTLWTKVYLTPAGHCNDVQITNDGGYILVGYKTSSFSSWEMYVIKTDANGDTLWTKTYGGNGGQIGKSIKQTIDGGYIICGETSPFGVYHIYLIKTDAGGEILWTRTFESNEMDAGNNVEQTTDGGYIIVGSNGGVYSTWGSIWLIKTNANGDTLWTKIYDGYNHEIGFDVKQTSDDGYIVVGETGSFGSFYGDVWLIKTDTNGDSIWSRTYGGVDYQEYGRCVEQTTDGGYVILGDTYTYGSGYPYSDFWLIRTDSFGDTLWTKNYGGDSFDQPSDLIITEDGGYAMVGYTWSYGIGLDVWLVRVGEPILTNLTPHNPPIQIPSGGGNFQFDLQIINQSQIAYTMDIWTDVSYQGSSPFPIITRTNITIPSGATITRPDLTQYVPASAQAGNYSYAAHVRDHNTWQVLTEDSFPFEKLAGDNTPNHNFGWSLLGWDEPTAQTTPTEFSLRPNYPNPFNPTTIISFTLPQASYVNLTVYNLAGGRVVELANKFLSAGRYTYAFNGTNLSSGIYIAKLQAGEYQASQKMILLK